MPFQKGNRPWNTGLTAAEHPSLAARSAKMRGRTAKTHPYLAMVAAKLRGRTRLTHRGPMLISLALRGRSKLTHEYIRTTENTKRTNRENKARAVARRVVYRNVAVTVGALLGIAAAIGYLLL